MTNYVFVRYSLYKAKLIFVYNYSCEGGDLYSHCLVQKIRNVSKIGNSFFFDQNVI